MCTLYVYALPAGVAQPGDEGEVPGPAREVHGERAGAERGARDTACRCHDARVLPHPHGGVAKHSLALAQSNE